jgi:hypothetical protein
MTRIRPDFDTRDREGYDQPTTNNEDNRTMNIKIQMNEASAPTGKLADAELHFTDGPLAGMKLIGFAVWERRNNGGRNVTFPARQYSVNGERRSFALLRPTSDVEPTNRIREAILEAFAEAERLATEVQA